MNLRKYAVQAGGSLRQSSNRLLLCHRYTKRDGQHFPEIFFLFISVTLLIGLLVTLLIIMRGSRVLEV